MLQATSRYAVEDVAAMKRAARRYILTHFANHDAIERDPRIYVGGDGCYLYDVEGRRYLDTFASLLTTICGHHRPEVREAVLRQLDELEFFPNYEDAFTPPLIELAEKLDRLMPGDLGVSFFVNSGSEANETALKIARQHHAHNGQPQRYKIVARELSYHGTTLGGISVTGLPWFRQHFEPLLPGVVFAPASRSAQGDDALRRFEQVLDAEDPRTISAVIMDPVPGSNTGYPLPPDGYLRGVRDLCDRHGIVLIFDEVQTGFGKTGRWFACEHWGVVPDIMTIGKGFSGGYVPLGAAVVTHRIARVFQASGKELRSGSTYGGHTIACAATLANLGIIERDGLVARARDMGDYLARRLETLRAHAIVSDVRGIGLLRAVELSPEPGSGRPFPPNLPVGSWIRNRCHERGMILRNNGSILVLAPALIVTREQIDQITSLLDEAIGAAVTHFGLGGASRS